MKLVLPERTYPDDAARRRFIDRAIDAVAAVPGVEHAAATNSLPASGSNSSRAIEIDGHPAPDPRNLPTVDNRTVSPKHFDVLRIPIQRGRAFTAADREDAAPVAIVSESMARKYWPGEDPIGRRLRIRNGPWITVVGISGDIIQDWFNRRNVPTMYRADRAGPVGLLRHRGPRRGRSGRRGRRGAPGAAEGGPDAAGVRDDHDARAIEGADDRPAVSRRDHDGVRRPRAVPRRGRTVRRDRVSRRAAAPRDRRPHRARRVARRRGPADGVPGAAGSR